MPPSRSFPAPRPPSRAAATAVLLLIAAAAGCGTEGTRPRDTLTPARVTDLRVTAVDDSMVSLAWTAPGDDGQTGTAAAYEIRWLNSPFTEPDWVSGTTIGPPPVPVAAGEEQTARVGPVPGGVERHLALRARDEAGNWSLVSNDVTATTGAPFCALLPDSLDFGRTPAGSSFDLDFILRNAGGGTLRGTIEEDCGAFSLAAGEGEFALRSGEERTVTVRFAPTAEEEYACVVRTGTGCAEVVLRGRGGLGPVSLLPVLVDSTRFLMGSPEGELGRDAEDERRHEVVLVRSLWVAAREVTQREWLAEMGWNESATPGADRPVDTITWFDAIEYCNRLSAREGLAPAYSMGEISREGNHIVGAEVIPERTRNGYRLPTEAEWEYLCRAESATAFFAGEISELRCLPLDPVLDAIGWYCGNASVPEGSRPVAEKPANDFGLRDTHGNVFEWCWDWYDPEYGLDFPPGGGSPDAAVDPWGPGAGGHRVCRGGSWLVNPQNCRSAYRHYLPPGRQAPDVGLRVVRALD